MEIRWYYCVRYKLEIKTTPRSPGVEASRANIIVIGLINHYNDVSRYRELLLSRQTAASALSSPLEAAARSLGAQQINNAHYGAVVESSLESQGRFSLDRGTHCPRRSNPSTDRPIEFSVAEVAHFRQRLPTKSAFDETLIANRPTRFLRRTWEFSLAPASHRVYFNFSQYFFFFSFSVHV